LSNTEQDIRKQPPIEKLLAKFPKDVADSFTDEQLTHLLTAIGTREWGSHKVDMRGTIKFPLSKWRYYYVFLFGRNRRDLTRKERQISIFATAVVPSILLTFSVLLGLLVLYLIKSALGIDLLPNHSLGSWHWFKGLFN